MEITEIDSIELKYLDMEDYQELKKAMVSSYQSMSDSYWKESHIFTLLDKFKEGQVVLKVNGRLAGH